MLTFAQLCSKYRRKLEKEKTEEKEIIIFPSPPSIKEN
jgi:hypothetical protein